MVGRQVLPAHHYREETPPSIPNGGMASSPGRHLCIYIFIYNATIMNKGPIENKIIKSLIDSMNISSLKVLNESFMHNVPKDSESHFKIVIVSNDFKNLSLIQRHKLVYESLDDIMNKIHALSIQSFSDDEFALNPIIIDSPECANKK